MQRMYVDAYENTEESLIATCTNNQLHVQNETFKSTIQQLFYYSNGSLSAHETQSFCIQTYSRAKSGSMCFPNLRFESCYEVRQAIGKISLVTYI